MTETSNAQPALSIMRLAELQKLAASMGLKGTSRMRKSELVAAIRDGAACAEPPPQDGAAGESDEPRPDLDDGEHHPQPRAHDL